MTKKTAVLTRAGMLPAAAALALLGLAAAHAENSPPTVSGATDKTTPASAQQKQPESELGATKAAATSPMDAGKEAAPTTTGQKPADTAAKPAEAAKPATTTAQQPADAAKKDATATAPAATAALPDTAPTTPPAGVADKPSPPADPIVASVRQKLPDAAKGANPDDATALIAYYGELIGSPIWISTSGFTAKAKAAVDEIGKADDWGLSASDFQVPQVAAGDLSPEAAADSEIKLAIAVLKYARYARGGRINPMAISQLVDQTPPVRDPKVVLTEIAAADAPDAYLRSLHPKHEQFELLRQALLKARGGNEKVEEPVEDPALAVKIPPGRSIVSGVKDPQVALLRQRLKVPADDAANETVYDAKLQEAVREFQRTSGLRPDGVVGNGTRNVLNGSGRPKRESPTTESRIERIRINMERWRWLPEQLGKLYVWDNVPEFLTRVVKDDKVIHTDKIIVGQPSWPTPAFSADMKMIVFHPSWGVPDGIKVKELWPLLRNSSGGGLFGIFGGGYSSQAVLEAYQLRAYQNGRPVDANQVDWSSANIRSFSFQQPPGPKNVLGTVKFMFPNKHDVYMHDTPERNLFVKSFRALSHGCMRVEEPRRLAEILLAEDKGWSPEKTRSMFNGYSAEVPLDTHIPVHVTYMTARVDSDGKLHTFGDFYGLDSRTAAALTGRSMRFEQPTYADDVVASGDDPGSPIQSTQRKQARKKQYQGTPTLADAITGIFSP